MALRLLTRYSGTAHIKATHDAEIFKSIFGLENKILSNGDNLEITVAAGTGTVTIGTGAFSFCGRVGIVDSDITATYARPASDTIYAKIGVAFKYERNTETNIETISAVALKSAEVASAALAAAESIEYGGTIPMTQIDSSSTEAYFIVGEFIATASAISGLEYKTEVLKSVATLAEDLATAESDLTTANTEIDNLTPVKIEDATIGGGVVVSITSAQAADYDYLIFIVRYIGQVKISKETFFTSAATGKKIYLGGYNEPYLEVSSTNLPTSVTLNCPSTGGAGSGQKFYVYGVNTQ